LEFITDLVGTIGTVVSDAVQVIVDAFLAFVEWAVAFIQGVVETVFGPIVDAISDLVDSYCSGVQSALKRAEGDVVATGSVSLSSLSMLSDALQGDLYWVLLGLATVIKLVLLAITPITITFGFLISVAISLIVTVVVQEALKVDETERWEGEPPAESDASYWEGWAQYVIGDGASVSQMGWSVIGGVLGIVAEFFGAAMLVLDGIDRVLEGKYLALGAISILIGWTATAVDSVILSLIGLIGSGIVLLHSIQGIWKNPTDSGKKICQISAIFGVTGIFCSLMSISEG
ncbi:MAG: hypothetical protein ACTSX2_04410, partial [Candidatus Thorarchaeota archaeon]